MKRSLDRRDPDRDHVQKRHIRSVENKKRIQRSFVIKSRGGGRGGDGVKHEKNQRYFFKSKNISMQQIFFMLSCGEADEERNNGGKKLHDWPLCGRIGNEYKKYI